VQATGWAQQIVPSKKVLNRTTKNVVINELNNKHELTITNNKFNENYAKVIPGFRRDVDEIYGLLGCYAAYRGKNCPKQNNKCKKLASHQPDSISRPKYENLEMVTAEIKRFARKHGERLHHHDSVEAIQLFDNTELLRRLKRTKPFEVAN
jgi:hypothetical protein